MLTIHHIHGGIYPEVQGSVGLEKIERALSQGKQLSFDDGLKCQELAFPLLKEYNAKAIFFINNRNDMERHRMIRESLGKEFYHFFWENYSEQPDYPETFLSEYDFYTPEDKAYRWVRDFSDPKGHDLTMEYISDITKEPEFIDPQMVIDEGHELGLHSATHPRRMDLMKPHEQYDEWVENLAYVKQFQEYVGLASYPMGRYNGVTKEILKQIGIYDAFTSSEKTEGWFERPRTDITKS